MEVRKSNRRKLELKKRKKSNKKGSVSDVNTKLKVLGQLKGLNRSKDKKLRKKSLVLEFKKIKQEIEEEIKQENKGKKKHYKSLFSSINDPLQDHASTKRLKLKRSKHTCKSRTKRKHEESTGEEVQKVKIRQFIKEKQK